MCSVYSRLFYVQRLWAMFAMMFAVKQHIRPYWAELFPNHDALATTLHASASAASSAVL